MPDKDFSSSWIHQTEFTLAQIMDLFKTFKTKGFKHSVAIAFNEALGTQGDDLVKLKSMTEFKSSDDMHALIWAEKPDMKTDRLLDIPKSPDAPAATLLRAYTERWAYEKDHGMNVFTSAYHMWEDRAIGRSAIMGIPDRLLYLSKVMFIQTHADKFQIGRIDHQVAPGGTLEYLL